MPDGENRTNNSMNSNEKKINGFSKDWYMWTGKAQYILDRVNEKKLRHRYFMENVFRFLRIKKR